MEQKNLNIDEKEQDIVIKATTDANYAASNEFIDWLNESEEHKKLYQDFMFYRQSALYAQQSVDTETAWNTFIINKKTNAKAREINPWTRIVKIAISAAAIIAMGLLFLHQPSTQDVIENKIASIQKELNTDSLQRAINNQQKENPSNKNKEQNITAYIEEYQEMIDNGTIQTEELEVLESKPGEPKHIILEDGTEVWVNVGSRISFLKHFGKGPRIVDLQGEAYFKVKHDAENPFVVRTPYFNTVDKGTSFNIKAYDKKTASVTLCEGEVSVSLPQAEQGISLQPGEKLTYGMNNHPLINRINISSMTAWMHGQFNYDDATLEEILDDISRYYDKQIIVNDKEVLAKRLKFWASHEDNFQDVMNTLIFTSGIDITMVDGSNCIYIVKHKD